MGPLAPLLLPWEKVLEWELPKEWRDWLREYEEQWIETFGQPWYETWWLWLELAIFGSFLLFIGCRCCWCCCIHCANCCCRGRGEEVVEEIIEVVQIQMTESEAIRQQQSERRRRAAERLRGQTCARACAFCGLDVFRHEAEECKGSVYHDYCFRCASCGRKLKGWPFGQVDDCLYCDDTSRHRGGHSCLGRVKLAATGFTTEMAVREGANQRMRTSEVELVAQAQQAAIEEIGDDLEEVVAGMRPTCALCGAPFGPADKLVMQGMMKFHKDCLEQSWRGKASTREGFLTPARACASAPGTLLFKLRFPQGKVMTFFLVRAPDNAKRPVTVAWLPDCTARASNKRKCSQTDLAAEAGVQIRLVGELGADVAPAERLAFSASSGKLSADFRWRACGLDWDLRARLEFDRQHSVLQSTRADLAVVQVPTR